MTTEAELAPLHLPARDIPVPASLSPEARALVATGVFGQAPAWPAIDDVEGWRQTVATADEMTLALSGADGALGALFGGGPAGELVERSFDGFQVYEVIPDGTAPDDRRVYLDIHGGAFVFGGGEMCRVTAHAAAHNVGARVWAVDYRMPPDHPHPTALDDCLAAYSALLEERRPEEIIVGGGSAGGNLAAALVVRARDEGLPLPAAVVLETGAFDLTASGDSRHTNLGLDPMLTDNFAPVVELYAAGADPRDPYLSPLYADLAGFPPAILTTGTRDLLLSDSVLMHRALRKAGVAAELHVWDAAGHGGFLGTAPEDDDRRAEVRRFADEHWARRGPR